MTAAPSATAPLPTTDRATGPRWRWWGVVAGIASGLFDTFGLRALGVSLEVNGNDVMPAVALFFASSFALLGFLLGYLVEQRRSERAMADVVHRQLADLAALRDRLAQSEKLAALGQLAAAIAHEVRNPLGVIRSAAQGIGESLTSDDRDTRRACAFITDEIDRLNGVITALLAFARPLKLDRRPTSVAAMLERATQLVARELAGRTLELRAHPPHDALAIEADADLATQALVDLLLNAAAVSPPGADIEVDTRVELDAVTIAVVDHGPGVPVELRERIFEPFFTTKPEGTGLGLAVARQIAVAHGGRLCVEAAAAGGSRFSLVLPRASAALVPA